MKIVRNGKRNLEFIQKQWEFKFAKQVENFQNSHFRLHSTKSFGKFQEYNFMFKCVANAKNFTLFVPSVAVAALHRTTELRFNVKLSIFE